MLIEVWTTWLKAKGYNHPTCVELPPSPCIYVQDECGGCSKTNDLCVLTGAVVLLCYGSHTRGSIVARNNFW